MAIPFFSIDFSNSEWRALIRSLVAGQLRSGPCESSLSGLLAGRYGDERQVLLLPSARFGFAVLTRLMFRSGDEVIVPAMGFPLYVKILLEHGVKPIFVDVEPIHYTIDSSQLRAAISSKTKGIVVTHLFGHPCDMDSVATIASEYGIPVIEDCAQSFGSFYKGKETGMFGHAALVSCSVMKVPTTLGGGVLITSDRELHERVGALLLDPRYHNDWKLFIRYLLFGIVSILNSYPFLYSLLSHHVFGLLKSRNPHLMRKILYSGLGLDNGFSLWERPKFSNYQAAIGIEQVKRSEEMSAVRRRHARIFDEKLAEVNDIQLPVEHADCHWNYQYYVIRMKRERVEPFMDGLFRRGIHLMQEDVWDCTRYPFAASVFRECPVAGEVTPGLVRIQNNSCLNSCQIERIGSEIVNYLKEAQVHI